MTTRTDPTNRLVVEAIAELLAHRSASAREIAKLSSDFRERVRAANQREAEVFEPMVLDSAREGAGRTYSLARGDSVSF
jgi:hypothetical protein